MNSQTFSLASHSASMFDQPSVAAWYVGDALTPPEKTVLIDRREDFRGRRALDLGVGAGRTTGYLLPYAQDYLGIDIAPQMLAHARKAHPTAAFREFDMLELDRLDAGSWDYVLGSYCAFDVFEPAQRTACLASIQRLMPSGGMFVFSAHNLGWSDAGQSPQLSWSNNPITLARNLRQHLISKRNFARMASHELVSPERAMLRDRAHLWQSVYHFVRMEEQVRELDALGFDTLELLGQDGRALKLGDSTSADSLLHYRCRRR